MPGTLYFNILDFKMPGTLYFNILGFKIENLENNSKVFTSSLIANITNREKLSGCKALWDYMGVSLRNVYHRK